MTYFFNSSLLNQLDVECDVKEVFRMGKRSSKPRLLKVRLQTGAQAKAAIANAKYIRDTDFHDFGIYIRQSMNDEERRQERERTKAQQEKIEQLKLQYPGKKFVIYAREICLSNGYRRDGRKNRPT
uniref:Uncharacterized protein n=1 Tax=Panagrolaimus sp. ES5 TaxID=591445 RepID=A0AC34FZT7_9BILA